MNIYNLINKKRKMLFSFHYFSTAGFLAVWTRSLSWPMLIHYVFQMSYFLAGGQVTDESLFWGWQALVSLTGTLMGLFIGDRPLLDANVYSWLYFIVSLAAYLGAQLMYAYFPPFPGSPAGQQGVGLTVTVILSVIIIGAIWYGMSREHKSWHSWLFGRWVLFTLFSQLLFFIALTGWAEVWLAISIGGGSAVLAFISWWFAGRKKSYGHTRARTMVRRPFV